MVVSDLHNGNGRTVNRPHGSLIENLLGSIPRHRTNDVIYLNPVHPERVISMTSNLLIGAGSDLEYADGMQNNIT